MKTHHTPLPADLEALFAKLPATRRPLPAGFAAELIAIVGSSRQPTDPEDLTAACVAIERAFARASTRCWHRPKEWTQ